MSDTALMIGPPPIALALDASLFLDFDGTLVELQDRPDRVTADPALRDLIARLGVRYAGRLAIVSGRSLEQLDTMLGEAADGIALAGSHGAELRISGETIAAAVPEAMDDAAAVMAAFAETHHGVTVERKTLGVALHYRAVPEQETEAVRCAAEIADRCGLYLQHGKMMVEVRADGDKGRALASLAVSAAMQGSRPLFLGDDVTDEAGFVAAAALGGVGILVGPPRETAAGFALADVAAVRAWLDAVVRA